MAIFKDKEEKDAKKPAKQAEPKAAKKEASEKKSVSDSVKPVASEQASAFRVLRRALVTEKGTELSSQNVVLFDVHPQANKGQIKQAVFEAYGIRPASVRTMRMQGKKRRFGRVLGRRSDWKKAMVTLPEGQSISVHDAV